MVGLSPPDDVRAGSRCGRGRRRSQSGHRRVRCGRAPGCPAQRRSGARPSAPVRGAPRPESGRPAFRVAGGVVRSPGSRRSTSARRGNSRAATRWGTTCSRTSSATAGISSAAAESCRRTASFGPIGPGGWRGCGVSCAGPDGGAGPGCAGADVGPGADSRRGASAPPPTRSSARLSASPAPEWPAIGVAAAGGPTAPGASDSGAGASVEACDADSEVGIVGDMDGGVPGCGARARGATAGAELPGSPAATTAVRMARPEAIATRRPSPAVAGQRHRVARARHRRRDPASPATRTATAPARARPGRCRPRAPRADPGSRCMPAQSFR